MCESAPLKGRIGEAFATYCCPDNLIATVEDLLCREFSLRDLCVVGQARSLFQSLALLQSDPPMGTGLVKGSEVAKVNRLIGSGASRLRVSVSVEWPVDADTAHGSAC